MPGRKGSPVVAILAQTILTIKTLVLNIGAIANGNSKRKLFCSTAGGTEEAG